MKKFIKCEKKESSIFSIYDPLVVKLLTRLRLQFSHVNEHKFRHGFGDTINAMLHAEVKLILELFENLEKVDSSFLNLNVKDKVSFLLYGSQLATSKSSNHEILKFVINCIKETGRFYGPLFCSNQ